MLAQLENLTSEAPPSITYAPAAPSRRIYGFLSDHRELVALAAGFVALCIMAVSIGAARSGVPLGEIAQALFGK